MKSVGYKVANRILPLPDGLDGERVDVIVSRLFGFSRSVAANMIENGQVSADFQPVLKSSQKLKSGVILEVEFEEEKPYETEITPVEGMNIVYDDEDIVVVDKPAGVAAHTGVGWDGPTVIGALASHGYRISTSGPVERKGIVHRLDAGTSGLMVVAKSELAYTKMKWAFKDRKVKKIYHALVQGQIEPHSATVDAPIGRHPGREWKMAVMSNGKEAVTHYDLIEMMNNASLLKINLETGRTHQIRVHMQAIGHPCVGDPTYGADTVMAEKLGLIRQWLHAKELSFEHPRTGHKLHFVSEYPKDLQDVLDAFRE